MSDEPFPFTSIKWDRDDPSAPPAEPQSESPLLATQHDTISEANELDGEAEISTEEPLAKNTPPPTPAAENHVFETESTPMSEDESTGAPDVTPAKDAEPQGSSSVSKPKADAVRKNSDPEPETAQVSPVPSSQAPTDALRQQIQDQKRMEELSQKYHIKAQVSNPISDRDGNTKAYISYLVSTESNHPDLKRLNDKSSCETISIKVRRRYGDFRFLHNCLVKDFPQLLVPPMPAKLNFKYLTGDTFSTSFVHKRLHSLDRFVSFICQHKLLSQLSVFHYFLSDSAEWSTFTKNLKISKGDDGEALLVGKVVNEDLLTETVMNFFTSSKHKRETNKDILEISDKLKKLYENLIKLDRIFTKLNKKNNDLKSDYELFLTQINKLASLHEQSVPKSESTPSDANSSFASNTDLPQLGVTTNFKIFSESLMYFLENWGNLYRFVDESFLVSLRDCAKYIAEFSQLIELHHNKKIDLQVLEDYLKKARADLANLGGAIGDNHARVQPPNPALISQSNGGIVNNTTQLIKDTLSTSATPHIGSSQSENKKWKLQQKIAQLEQEIVVQTQLVNNLTSRIIDEEYPNWDRFNKRQLKQSMTELCDQEITFYKGLVNNWTDVETKLMRRLEELE